MDNIINENQFVFFIPKSQYSWKYMIDNGKEHSISQDRMIEYLETLVKKSEVPKIMDIIQRHQPFIVIIKEKIVKELHKEKDTKNYHRELIDKDLKNPILNNNSNLKSFKSVDNFYKKFYKI